MNFRESKEGSYTKKSIVRAFEVNHTSKDKLFEQLKNNKKFKADADFQISKIKKIRIREISYTARECYCHVTIYNPKESVSITPIAQNNPTDLIDVDNYDTCHFFMLINENYIRVIFQISFTWPENKLHLFFEQLDIYITPTPILDSQVVSSLQDEGFKALHINTVIHSSKTSSKDNIVTRIAKKVPKVGNKGVYGNIRISGKGNPEIANSIEQTPQIWVNELDGDFYIETKKGNKITGDKIKLHKIYYTLPYGSKTITPQCANEILSHFRANVL
ncbi:MULTISPECIES: hypothetical protein [Lelliottia]|uniref:Uncharacterized protein n=1 Tax=Lelliottia aquatilis TaxID=2080838 RepID=A0ABX5A2Z4_9ENTR|nr:MULTISPECIES: hypothetical protein [Lelliottia]POZ14101.1 hypothetical protein C3Z09_20205 [Lelliottia aquatilis]POZ24004.1 hypothetical protein C3712_07210 [Lelliottia aquatilis]POZ27594.1 hypothetical protein C3708_08445 [Lelliottia sp. 7254-16]POZ29864.1 hypothetical protein C3711_01655 [Lelliottia aquatilis]POZ35429.1 hypothetical protein C3710_01655 [Lelliottia aquatilis]